jgi:glycosyltransferase involved in cell wall biosynthesis
MKIFYDTIPGHLVSGIEKKNLQKAFDTVGIKLVADINDADIYLVKSFFKEWDSIKHLKGKLPIVLQCFGVQWREGINLEIDNKKLTSMINKVDGRVFMSNFAASLMENYYQRHFNDNGDAVIFNSQDFKISSNPPTIDGNVIKCATTAVWRDWKRMEDTIAFVQKWNKNRRKNRIELHIGGNVTNKIQDPMIVYHGFVNDLSYYKDMHFYIYPSLMETFGNSVAEAIGYGLPVLTTNFGAVPEVIGGAGVCINNEPVEYLNFTKRPVMYGGGLIRVQLDMMEIGMIELIDEYDKYRVAAAARALALSHEQIGRQWLDYFTVLLREWKEKQNEHN